VCRKFLLALWGLSQLAGRRKVCRCACARHNSLNSHVHLVLATAAEHGTIQLLVCTAGLATLVSFLVGVAAAAVDSCACWFAVWLCVG
jgi:hypothetical protein